MLNRRIRRIGIVSHLALPHVGGVEVVVDMEIRALLQAGCEVRLVTSDGTGNGHCPTYSATSVIRVPSLHFMENRLGLPFPLFGPRLFPELLGLARWADVLHVHGSMFMGSVVAAVIANIAGLPLVVTEHGGRQVFRSSLTTWAARCGWETLARCTVNIAKAVFTFNTRIMEDVHRLGAKRVVFLPNPVDHSRFSPPTSEERQSLRQVLGWETSRKKVLFVGRFIETKGVAILAQAGEPDYDLVFCGPGDKGIIENAGSRSPVEILAPRPQSSIADLYRAADVLALPSMREGFPLVVQEALACGLPVVLGHDRGYEPYRQLPQLFLCDHSIQGVQSSLRLALGYAARVDSRRQGIQKAQAQFFPSLPSWAERFLSEVEASIAS